MRSYLYHPFANDPSDPERVLWWVDQGGRIVARSLPRRGFLAEPAGYRDPSTTHDASAGISSLMTYWTHGVSS